MEEEGTNHVEGADREGDVHNNRPRETGKAYQQFGLAFQFLSASKEDTGRHTSKLKKRLRTDQMNIAQRYKSGT